MSPKVSIILPSYNHAAFLLKRLDSVFSQTFQDFEVILLDDKSTDASASVLEQYANHPKVSHFIVNDLNSGNTFSQWKKGISLAKGEFIWIAETDDYCEPTFLEKMLEPFEKEEEVVIAFCQSNRVNEHNEITGSWITQTKHLDPTLFLKDFSMDGNLFIERFLIFINVIPNASAVVFRKKAVDLDKHFDINRDFTHCGDWMFYIKLIINKKVAFVGDSLNNFRYHKNSVIGKLDVIENKLKFIDIEIRIRKLLLSYFKKNALVNYTAIRKQNKFIKRNYLQYPKIFLLVKAGHTIKGYLLLLSMFDLFYKHYNFKKNIIIKFKQLMTIN